jgi:ACR3 family arsenite efflux pump ArsB
MNVSFLDFRLYIYVSMLNLSLAFYIKVPTMSLILIGAHPCSACQPGQGRLSAGNPDKTLK